MGLSIEYILNTQTQTKILKKFDTQTQNSNSNTQKLIDSVSNSILSVTDIIATFQQARAEKEAEAINEQITNTENNITELEAISLEAKECFPDAWLIQLEILEIYKKYQINYSQCASELEGNLIRLSKINNNIA